MNVAVRKVLSGPPPPCHYVPLKVSDLNLNLVPTLNRHPQRHLIGLVLRQGLITVLPRRLVITRNQGGQNILSGLTAIMSHPLTITL